MSFKLSKYFTGISAKRLSPVEIKPTSSNQHEFNGTKDLKDLFGAERKTFKGKFIYLTDFEEHSLSSEGPLTWYDAREKHPIRSEYRFYYKSNPALEKALPNDLMIIAKVNDEQVFVIVASSGSTIERQLLWLFGLDEVESGFVTKDYSNDNRSFGFAGRYILSELGIEIDEEIPDFLEEMQALFGTSFPPTRVFSEFSRRTVKDVDPINDPDNALITWLTREELLFKTFETVIVRKKLQEGFGSENSDVDEFIRFSLSVQNRRKSRAGFSFENNLAYLFTQHGVSFSQGAVTERNNKPDFVFPSIKYYHLETAKVELLTMLGVKTTAKDRWRQILSEAQKIGNKHLITLEPAISRNQTADMKANNIQLVIPTPLFETYAEAQRSDLISVKDFINLVKERQKHCPNDQAQLFPI